MEAQRCSQSGCPNFGGSYLQGVFCSVHAREVGATKCGGKCHRCVDLPESPPAFGYGVKPTAFVQNIELPSPFTQIEQRIPVFGEPNCSPLVEHVVYAVSIGL